MTVIRNRHILAAVGLSALLAGCGASIPGLSTSSLGGNKPAPLVAQNDPPARAFEVASTSARAIKCGYNFDPGKLRYQYIASESAANPQDAEKVSQMYDATFNGVTKAVVAQGDGYCSAEKTRKIKEALTRHLAGDYTPSPPEAKEEEEGLFSGWGGSSSSGGVKTPLPGVEDP